MDITSHHLHLSYPYLLSHILFLINHLHLFSSMVITCRLMSSPKKEKKINVVELVCIII